LRGLGRREQNYNNRKMKNAYLLAIILFCCTIAKTFGQTDSAALTQLLELKPVQLEAYHLQAEPGRLVFKADLPDGLAQLSVNGSDTTVVFQGGTAALPLDTDARGKLLLIQNSQPSYRLYHISERTDGSLRLKHIPMWLSIIPPLAAILLALLFREVIVSLFIGVWAGAFIAGGMRLGSIYYFLLSFFEVVEKYVVAALADSGHVSIIVFSLLIGGMVAIISRNGGMAGVVELFSRYARSPRSAQFMTWLLGVAIFFDDYANTLIVGNTMRKVTDRFRVSREKLAYIVDSTAAPVASVAFITTWIGAELGYIDDGIKQLEGFNADLTPYAIFLASLKYSFYPVLALAFILLLVYFKRDFGSMYHAERRARQTGEVSLKTDKPGSAELEDLSPVAGAPIKWYNAVIPVSLVILVTIYGLTDTGMASTYAELMDEGILPASPGWGDIWAAMSQYLGESAGTFMKLGKLVGNSDSYVALLWASLAGAAAAILLTLGGRIMSLGDTINTLSAGFKTMLPAVLILTMAWSLAATTKDLHTANFLASALQDSVNPHLMPAIIFILAAVTSFSTGSSWSTMAILYPIAIPATWAICISQGMDYDHSLELLLNVIATTLGASVLGDHCSPISDTTILSSLASDCNHIDHVRTQMPYALTVGAVSILAGTLATYLGGSWLISLTLLLLSLAILAFIVLRVGKRVD
jgi:Na+/H+ antiporter NhaC